MSNFTLMSLVLGLMLIEGCCLASVSRPTAHLIGGTQIADKARYPWMVLMQGSARVSATTEKKITCGATLINSWWAISAAHCYSGDSASEDASKWIANVGTLHEYDFWHRYPLNWLGILFRKPEWQSWRLGVASIHRHPNFVNAPMFDHDIALLKLRDEAPVGTHPRVNILALPAANDTRIPGTNTSCAVTGWGCTAEGGTVQEQELEVQMPVLSRSECLQYWRGMTDNQFCAGRAGEGKGVCAGDSGGPMVCKNGTVNFLAGIISYADKDHPERYPSAFIQVAKYVDWIRSVMANN